MGLTEGAGGGLGAFCVMYSSEGGLVILAELEPGQDALAEAVGWTDVDALLLGAAVHVADGNAISSDPDVTARQQIAHTGADAAIVDRRPGLICGLGGPAG